MSSAPVMPSGSALIREAARRLVRPPLVLLTGINLLIWGVAKSIQPTDGTGVLSYLLLSIITAYVNIALILASADPEPQPTADHWLKAAWRRRTFWRYSLTDLLIVLLVLLGAIALLVPAFLIGAAVGVGAQAAVLEGLRPAEAIRRSMVMTKPARRAVGIVFGALVLVPQGLLQASFFFGRDLSMDPLWIGLEAVVQIFSALSIVALTRAFLILGGQRVPVTRARDQRQ